MDEIYQEEIEAAKKAEFIQRQKELDDIKKVLKTKYGRDFVWKILTHCNVFGSIWVPSAKIHYNSGKQDLGHYLMAEIMEADEQLFFKMMKENNEKETKE